MEHKQNGLRHNISFITLGVEDLNRSRNFYMSMGLEEHPSSNENVAFFDMSGQFFALFDRESLAEDAGVELTRGGGITGSLSQNVADREDIDHILSRAAMAGGRIVKQPSSPPWGGVRGYFSDPDGFIWEIAWNPATRIDKDGRVHLGTDIND